MDAKRISLGLVLVSTALHAGALTIGPTRGAVWIGQPLELSFTVQRDAPGAATELCAEAAVVYGESLQGAADIQLQQDATDQPDTVVVRLRSKSLVNEPVVSINLRVGCEQKFERRFVLLADLPVVSRVLDIPLEPALAEAPTPVAALPPAQPMVAQPPPARKPTVRPRAPRMLVTRAKPAESPPGKPLGAQGSRLRLDPLENLAERVKTLETTAAAVPPEVPSKDAQRVQQLESELQGLRLKTAANEEVLLSMRMRLERAETERVSAAWFYGFMAVLVVCIAAIVTLWQRRRTPSREYQEPTEEPEPYEAQFLRPIRDAEKFEPPPVFESHATRVPQPLADPALPTALVDVDLVELNEIPGSEALAGR